MITSIFLHGLTATATQKDIGKFVHRLVSELMSIFCNVDIHVLLKGKGKGPVGKLGTGLVPQTTLR